MTSSTKYMALGKQRRRLRPSTPSTVAERTITLDYNERHMESDFQCMCFGRLAMGPHCASSTRFSSGEDLGRLGRGYLPLHLWFDQSKAITADFRHRGLRIHAEGIFMLENGSSDHDQRSRLAASCRFA